MVKLKIKKKRASRDPLNLTSKLTHEYIPQIKVFFQIFVQAPKVKAIAFQSIIMHAQQVL